MKPARATQAILSAGLTAGVLDLLAAIVINNRRGVTPLRIAQSIASGWLGTSAYQGGYKTAALGVVSHPLIALGAATVYYLASRRLPLLLERPYLSGASYGIAVYWFMQLVVLPLSAFPHKTASAWSVVLTGIIVHILCVGSPIALITRWYAQSLRD